MTDRHNQHNNTLKTVSVNSERHLFDSDKSIGDIREECVDAMPDDLAIVVLEDDLKVVPEDITVGEIPGSFRIFFRPPSDFIGADLKEVIRWQNRIITQTVWPDGVRHIGDEVLIRNQAHSDGDRKVICLHSPSHTIYGDQALHCQGVVAGLDKRGQPLIGIDDLINKINR